MVNYCGFIFFDWDVFDFYGFVGDFFFVLFCYFWMNFYDFVVESVCGCVGVKFNLFVDYGLDWKGFGCVMFVVEFVVDCGFD